ALVDRVPRDALVAGPARAAGGRPVLDPLLGQDLLAAVAELLDDGLRVLLAQGPVVALVDRGHRGDVAGAHALEAADEDLAVLGRARAIHPGRLAEPLEQLVSAAQPAADVGADQDLVLALRLHAEEVVEAGDRLEIARGHAHHRGGLVDPLRGAPAVAPLDGPESRDRGRALARVALHRAADLLRQRPGDRHLGGLGDRRRL